MLFELATSRRLFRGGHDLETLRLVISGAIPKPTLIDANYPPKLQRIVLKALERDVSQRYQTAAEFEHALCAFLTAERLIVPPGGVAGILKRVLGGRIEQRRMAVRASLKELDSGAQPSARLLSSDLAFTPTGKERSTVSGVSSVTGPSSNGLRTSCIAASENMAVHTTLDDPRPGERGARLHRLSTASLLGYAIGWRASRSPCSSCYSRAEPGC